MKISFLPCFFRQRHYQTALSVLIGCFLRTIGFANTSCVPRHSNFQNLGKSINSMLYFKIFFGIVWKTPVAEESFSETKFAKALNSHATSNERNFFDRVGWNNFWNYLPQKDRSCRNVICNLRKFQASILFSTAITFFLCMLVWWLSLKKKLLGSFAKVLKMKIPNTAFVQVTLSSLLNFPTLVNRKIVQIVFFEKCFY